MNPFTTPRSAAERRPALFAGGVILTTALALSACGAGGETPEADASTPAGADATQTLTVLVEGGGKAELEPVAAAYTAQTGTTVTFVELPYDGLYDRLSSELSSGNVSFDVAALDAIWMTAFADGVVSLDELRTAAAASVRSGASSSRWSQGAWR